LHTTMLATREWWDKMRELAAPQRTCPAGHPVTGSRALRCPTCGRLVPRRFARVCPNGHVVSGPHTVCPYCGEAPGPARAWRVVGLAAVAAFLALMMIVFIADVPQRLIDLGVETAESAEDWAMELFTSLDLPLFE
jgi:hypothetical protein